MMKNLIPNMWYAILDSSEVPMGKPVGFKRLGVELVFWRDSAGKVAVMHDRCPHRQSK
jgi:phenylpropionate dioxygenase-like ring-hydroxylating dioxygenase large terminal subunit